MKIYTKVVREGEKVGEIDYAYKFRDVYEGCCTSPESRDEICKRDVERLRGIERRFKAGEPLDVCIRDWWHQLIDVGMYDGAPFWSPTPAVLVAGTLGSEWQFWYEIVDVRTSTLVNVGKNGKGNS